MDIFDKNNIKLKYNAAEISIAQHSTNGFIDVQEVAVILPIKIVERFDSSVESLEQALQDAKKITDKVNELSIHTLLEE